MLSSVYPGFSDPLTVCTLWRFPHSSSVTVDRRRRRVSSFFFEVQQLWQSVVAAEFSHMPITIIRHVHVCHALDQYRPVASTFSGDRLFAVAVPRV